MRAVLEYTLPVEEQEYRDAYNGWRYRAVIEGVMQWLRDDLKHGEVPDAEREVYERLRTRIFDDLDAHGLTLD